MIAIRLIYSVSRDRVGIILLDQADAAFYDQNRWNMQFNNRTGYLTSVSRHGGQGLLHRLLTSAQKGALVDHRNRNVLDNRRSNLRIADDCTNQQNQCISKLNTSGVKGVYQTEYGWRAEIKAFHQRYAKRFKIKQDAIDWARTTRENVHGEFARHA